MLKSHFNIKKPTDENEEEIEEEASPQESEDPVAVVVIEEDSTVVEEEEEEVPEIPYSRRLKKSEISVRLSLLGKVADADGYAFLEAKCTGMGLYNIVNIKCFKYLQYVDFSDNNLTINALQPVTQLPYIVLVKADNNPPLTSAGLNRTKYMQVIIMNHNAIKKVEDVYQPQLSTLDLGYNKITNVNFLNRMPYLRVLDFRYNLIKDIENWNFSNLDSLYLAGNKISRLDGLTSMPNLRVLHVRNNPIRFLTGFDRTLEKLEYINFRGCKISSLKQVKNLKVLPALTTLILKGCPYVGGTGDDDQAQEEEDPEVRVEVLATLQQLKRLNKTEYTDEERQEAKDLMIQWIEEGEREDEEEVEEAQPEEDYPPE